jgi:hypothetical protein
VLLQIPKDVIARKQRAIEFVAPRVQYAIPPPLYLEDRYDSTPWDPPFQDAAEITLDGILDRVERLLRNESTNLPPPHMISKSWAATYEVVIAKDPGAYKASM